MTFNEFQSMMLFRRIVDSNSNSITLDNGVRLINADFSNVVLNNQITLATVYEDGNVELSSNGDVICEISSIDSVEVVMPEEPSKIRTMNLQIEKGEKIEG